MTTGGIARVEIAEQVLASGVAVVGVATALSIAPDLPRQWHAGQAPTTTAPHVNWKDKTLASIATMALVRRRMRALSANGIIRSGLNPLFTLLTDQLRGALLTRRYRKWRARLLA
jgi:transposase-like protein